MLTQLVQAQALGSRQVSTRLHFIWGIVHLAVYWGSNVEVDQEKNYDHDGGPACNQVNLSNRGQLNSDYGKLKVRADRHVPISSIDRLNALE